VSSSMPLFRNEGCSPLVPPFWVSTSVEWVACVLWCCVEPAQAFSLMKITARIHGHMHVFRKHTSRTPHSRKLAAPLLLRARCTHVFTVVLTERQ